MLDSSAPLSGMLLALPKNIVLGCKGLPWKNTLAYYEYLNIHAQLSGMLQALPKNIVLGLKGLPGKNTLANYKHSSSTLWYAPSLTQKSCTRL